jgi:predicted nucleotidyltransferase
MQDFSQLLSRLADAGLDFVIVGGFAATTHGSAYLTKDVDICLVLSDENIARLRDALTGLNPRHRMTPQKLSFLTHPPAGQSLQNIYLQTDLGIIDVLTSVLGVGDFANLRSRAEDIEVDGRIFHVISLDDLITAKEAMGREKDLLTAKELKAIRAKRAQG